MDYKDKDYKELYEEFWKRYVENEDGTLDKDKVMRELADYSMVTHNCSMAYSTMTDGTISKQNTRFSAVEEIFNELYFSKNIFDIHGDSEDLIDILKDSDNVDELKQQILEYFGIRDDLVDEVGD